MKVLDLFSGIGGFSLGLERAGMETIAFCEIEPYPQAVLRHHWPDVPIYDDVRTLTAERLAADGISVDVITGGFPCQDVSSAGKRAGIGEGTRSGLYGEIIRLSREISPRFIIMENVSDLLCGPSEQRGGWFGTVLGDLAEIGYDAEWHCIPASYLGALHRRDRVWLVAYPNTFLKERGTEEPILRQQNLSIELSRGFEKWSGRSNLPESRFHRAGDGVSCRSHRLASLGNAVVPQIPEIIGRAIMESVRAASTKDDQSGA